MRKIIGIIIFLTSVNIYTQEKKKIFNTEYKTYVIQCENIGSTIINKNVSLEIDNWYEGNDKEKVVQDLKQLEYEIDISELDVTYYLMLMNKKPLIYTYHFYNKETKAEFGQLFIQFKDRENNLVDYVRLVNSEKLKEIETQADLKNDFIPPPPPPPIEKKNNGN